MRPFTLNVTCCFCFLLMVDFVFAQKNDTLQFYIDLPFIEYPYNFKAEFPTASMDQSVQLSKSFYFATHFGIELFGKRHLGKNGDVWSKVIMSIVDFAPIPFSNTWLHEEYHRSILSLYEIESRNTFWSNSVRGVKDEDLVHFKLDNPSALVREATAGSEGNLEFVLAIEKDVFFNEVTTWNYGLYWGNYLVNSFYLFGSTQKGSKPLVKFKNSENENILKRDANGYDPINATYDLFNPFISYTERGTHPSGIGVDRYVEFNDLSEEAQGFLNNQFKLSLLNFIDLNLLGIDELGTKTKFNFSMRHHMTSFGFMVGGNVFFKNKKLGGIFSPKIYRNENNSFLGLEIELRNNWGMIRLAGWQQPSNQLFYDTNKKLGGFLQVQFSPPFKKFLPYIDLSLKSDGWLAANPYLENNFTVKVGGRMKFKNK